MTPETQRRAILAAAAAIALVAVAGAGLFVVRGGDDASLATVRPSASATPSPSPSATPAATPAPTPTAAPSSAPPALALDDAFLSPEQAGAAESPGWAVDEAYEPSPGPVYDPCGDGAAPLQDSVLASAERAMESEREAGGSSLVQELYGYADEDAAQDALIQYVLATERCPTADVPDTEADSVERTVLPVADDRFLVRERYCNPECTGLYSSFTLLARSGQAVTVAAYAQGEDAEPEDPARALLDATAEQLAAAVRG